MANLDEQCAVFHEPHAMGKAETLVGPHGFLTVFHIRISANNKAWTATVTVDDDTRGVDKNSLAQVLRAMADKIEADG